MHAHANPAVPDRSSGRIASFALLAICALWCLYWFIHARGYWEDDAWIHLEFARSVSEGRGFAFNGHVVAGDTAPLWVFLLAGAHVLIPNWLAAGKALTVLGALFGLAGIYAFARRIAKKLLPAPSAAVFPAALLLLVAVNPYICYWIFSGMEAVAAAGLACWAVLLATRERPTPQSFLAGCLLAGLGPLVRPEMTFLAALLALPLLGQWQRLRATPAVKFACLLAGLLLLSGPYLGWALYSLHAFGHLLPNTNAAKRAGPHESVLRRLIVVYATGLPVLLCGAAAGLVHLLAHPARVARSLRDAIASALTGAATPHSGAGGGASPISLPAEGWLFVLWILGSSVFYVANHTYVQTRYVLITAPGTSIVILALALSLWPRCGRIFYAITMAAAVGVSLVVVVPFVRNKAAACEAVRQIAHFMRDRLPPGAPVAVYAIGQIAFESQQPIIDTGGITRPDAIPYLNAPLSSMARWAQAQGAEYYVEAHPPLPGSVAVFRAQVPFSGWTLKTSQFALAYPIALWQLPSAPQPAHPIDSGTSPARVP